MLEGNPVITQLDRIEAKLDELLTKKKTASKHRASKTGEYSKIFENTWANYPKRAGSNPKVKAYSAYNKRLLEGCDPDLMLDGLIDYSRFCDATGKTNTELVMQGSRFFGPALEYMNDWTPPAPKTKTGATEITTASHDRVDFNKLRSQEQLLDATDPYASLK